MAVIKSLAVVFNHANKLGMVDIVVGDCTLGCGAIEFRFYLWSSVESSKSTAHLQECKIEL